MNDIDSLIKQIQDMDWKDSYWHTKDEFIRILRELDDSSKVEDLEYQIQSFSDEIYHLEEDKEKLENEVADLEDKKEELEIQLKDSEKEVERLEKRLEAFINE